MKRKVSSFLLAGIISVIRVQGQSSPIVPPPLIDSMTPGEVAPGTPDGSYVLSGFDSVNYGNLSVGYRFPLLKIGGRGTASTVIMPDFTTESEWTVVPSPVITCTGGGEGTPCTQHVTWNYNISNDAGWSPLPPVYGVPRMMLREGALGCNSGYPSGSNWASSTLSRLTFIAPDGTETALIDLKSGGEPQSKTSQNSANYDRGATWVTRDGTSGVFTTSGADVTDAVGNATNCSLAPSGVSGTLVMKDGTKYVFSNGYASTITDRNGNYITFNYTGGPSNASAGTLTGITDPLGRTYGIQLNLTDNGSGRKYDLLTYPGFGTTRQIKIFYDQLDNVLRSDQSPKNQSQLWPNVLSVNQVPSPVGGLFISEILLPDGSAYTFQRDSYGNIARIQLPTGGAVEYDWLGIVDGSSSPSSANSVILRCYLTERREYAVNSTTKSRVTNYSGGTVTEYEGGSGSLDAKIVHNVVAPSDGSNLRPTDYDNPAVGQEPSTVYYDKDGTTVLRTIARTYQERSCTGDPTCWWTSGFTDRPPHDYLIWQETTTEGTLNKQTVTLYDQYNNENSRTESDWGTGASGGSVLRTISTTYNTGSNYISANILNLASEVKVLNSAGSITADTTYGYDQTALAPESNIVDYLAPSTPRGNRTTITECVGLTTCNSFSTTYAYDVAGNAVSVTDGDNHTTRLVYTDSYTSGSQSTYAHVTSITNPLNQSAYWQYDYGTGHVTQVTDLSGSVTKYTYAEPLDRVTNIAKAVGTSAASDVNVAYTVGTTEIDVYSDQSAVNSTGSAIHTETLYDGFGRESSKELYESASSIISTATTYDAMGRIYTKSNPSRGNDGLGYLTTHLYDGLNRPLSITTGADNAVVNTCYFTHAALCASAPTNTSGSWVLTTDQAGKQIQAWTDGLGRLAQVTEDPGMGAHMNYVTTYGYDALDDLTSVNQSGLGRSFSYDGLKRLRAAYNPENASAMTPAHLTCAAATGSTWSTCYSYDNVGNLLTKMDNRGVTATYSYDSLNRLTSKVFSGAAATPSAYYCYDGVYNTFENSVCQNAPAPSYAVGRLTEVTNGTSATLHTSFDALGRVLAHSQVTNGNTYTFGYTYNLAGDLTCETYPSGRVVVTAYDLANRVSQVAASACPAAGTNPSLGLPAYVTGASSGSGIQYAPHGAPNLYFYGNNLARSSSFNGRMQMNGFVDALNNYAGNEFLNVTLSWYPVGGSATTNNGTLSGSTYNNGGATANNGGINYTNFLTFNQTYGYDNVNRLSSITDTGYTRSFSYDALGNMWVNPGATGVSPAGNTPQSNVYNSYNQISSGSYDAAGNQLVVNGNTVTYDAEGRQTSVTGGGVNESYVYDGDGQRVEKVAGGAAQTVFVYDALGRMAAEYSASAEAPACITCYMSPDHLGTPRMVTDQNANVVARHDYLPFGDEVGANVAGRNTQWGAGNDSINQKFTGKERDSESGLDYFGARYYGSALGRFTSADWSEKPEPVPYADFSNPQTLNQYAYVLNNPLAHPDKDGHCCDDELTWAGNVAKSFANSFISLANTVINTPDPDVPIPNGPEINIPTFTVNSGSANVVGTVLGMAVPLGGEGSGLSKGAQMLENAAQGAAGEAKVAGELVSEGTTILGSRVGVQTDKGLRVVDHLTDAGNGGLKAVEVKTGGATRNAAQLAKDDAMATRGGKIVGKNAPEGLRGQTRKIPTEVRKPNDQ